MPAATSDSRRDPVFRIAVFFRRARRFAPVCVAAWLGLLLLAAPRADAAPARPATPRVPATIRVEGVAYTEARLWFARHGHRADYDAEQRRLTFDGPGGRIVFTVDSREFRLHGLRVFLSEPAILVKGVMHLPDIDLERFIAPMLRPDRLPAQPLKTIVLDAGHGGTDGGTRNQSLNLNEKAFTLDVARRLRRLLGDDKWRVIFTREDDRFVSLADRAEFANRAGADLFVSIHFNAVANNPAVRGTETYVLTPQHMRSTSSPKITPDDKQEQPGNRHDAWNAVLGHHMHRELIARLKTEDRGYKRARFAVLRLVDCPAVLVEAGYLSNEDEARLIATEAYRRKIAEALHTAILAYDAARASAGR